MEEKHHILLVDDDEAVLKSLGIWLKNEGYAVFKAKNGEQAFQIQKKHPIDLCLVDLRLKDEDGVKLSTELKHCDETLKIIILTGFATYESAVEALKSGAFDYIAKTAEPGLILQKIRSAIEERKSQWSKKRQNLTNTRNLVQVCHHVLIKEGLQKFCKENPEFQLLHTYFSCDYLNRNDFDLDPHLLLLCSGCNQPFFEKPAETIFKLKLIFPNAKLMIVNSELSQEQSEELIRLGVKGILPANISKESLKKAFLAVLGGQLWISRSLSDKLLSTLLDKGNQIEFKKPTALFNLTRREIEILQALASGLSNFDISEKLYLSEMTIKTHIHHIFEKMDVKTRTQAVLKALENHII